MTTKPSYKPWHEVVQLRDDLKTGELSLAVFAADLYDVIMQKGQRPVYEHPAEFFALTYPTYNLRELVKDVALRLAGKSDKGVPKALSQLRRRQNPHAHHAQAPSPRPSRATQPASGARV